MFAGAYWVLKGKIATDAQMDTTVFRIVDLVIVILPELSQINVMRMVFVNVINMANAFARLVIRVKNV